MKPGEDRNMGDDHRPRTAAWELRPVMKPGEDRNIGFLRVDGGGWLLRPVMKPGEDRNALDRVEGELRAGRCARS